MLEYRLSSSLPAGVAVVNYHYESAGIDFTEWYGVSVPSPVANTSFIDWLRTRLSLQEAAPYARPDDPSWWLDQLAATGRDTYQYEDHLVSGAWQVTTDSKRAVVYIRLVNW